MCDQTLDLNMVCQKYLSKEITVTTTGFMIQYNSKKYIISIHHYLPINRVFANNLQSISIIINSSWSEILVLETNDKITVPFIKDLQCRFPKIGSNMLLSNKKRYSLKVTGYVFCPYDNLNKEHLLPYIKATIDEEVNELYGLSGSPVFIGNKLVGIFSKYNCKEKVALIIPTYILIKNLTKKDNHNIYKLPVSKIIKINFYNIKEDMIYHPKIKLEIPLNTYLLLEGDVDFIPSIQYYIDQSIDLNTKDLKSYSSTILTVKNIQAIVNNDLITENRIVTVDNKYKINIRLLSLLKRIYDPPILFNIFTTLASKQKTEESWLVYENKKIKII